jgi:hypothetical protein
MEHQLWLAIVAVLRQIDKSRPRTDVRFSDQRIVEVFYWAVLHDRPLSWAAEKHNWPIWLRRHPLPSCSTLSRRLRSQRVVALLRLLDQRLVRHADGTCRVWLLDGKPLTISGISKDRQAGYGRAARSMAKGYKLHVLMGVDNTLADWRLAPMNVDERKMAARMLRRAAAQGYVVADANYDSNKLYRICDEHGGLQLVAPRRYGPDHGTGHRRQAAGRLRAIELLEGPSSEFGLSLLAQRSQVERRFGNLTNWGGGLTHLPPWVRTYRRVHRWVQAKLVLQALKAQRQQTTYVA